MIRASAFAELLAWRAAHEPDRVGYVFLADDREVPTTYRELDRRARAVAVRLRLAGVGKGDRALLLQPPGAELLTALFGCLYAGVVAVPAAPPDPMRLDRTLPRLRRPSPTPARPRCSPPLRCTRW